MDSPEDKKVKIVVLSLEESLERLRISVKGKKYRFTDNAVMLIFMLVLAQIIYLEYILLVYVLSMLEG